MRFSNNANIVFSFDSAKFIGGSIFGKQIYQFHLPLSIIIVKFVARKKIKL